MTNPTADIEREIIEAWHRDALDDEANGKSFTSIDPQELLVLCRLARIGARALRAPIGRLEVNAQESGGIHLRDVDAEALLLQGERVFIVRASDVLGEVNDGR